MFASYPILFDNQVRSRSLKTPVIRKHTQAHIHSHISADTVLQPCYTWQNLYSRAHAPFNFAVSSYYLPTATWQLQKHKFCCSLVLPTHSYMAAAEAALVRDQPPRDATRAPSSGSWRALVNETAMINYLLATEVTKVCQLHIREREEKKKTTQAALWLRSHRCVSYTNENKERTISQAALWLRSQRCVCYTEEKRTGNKNRRQFCDWGHENVSGTQKRKEQKRKTA